MFGGINDIGEVAESMVDRTMAGNAAVNSFKEGTDDDTDSTASANGNNDGIHLHCFSDEAQDGMLHFQILQLNQQLYIWIGCNSAKFGNLYASLPTPFDKAPSLASLIGGGADSTGASIARRLALRTGWSIVLACNLPKNSPMLEAHAERRLLQELKILAYIQPVASK